jgi:hypothetical protein
VSEKGSREEDRIFHADEVAARYGYGPQWPYRCADLRKIAFKMGKRLCWRESDLIALEEYRSGPGHKGFDLVWRMGLIEKDPDLLRHLYTSDARKRKKFELLFDFADEGVS